MLYGTFSILYTVWNKIPTQAVLMWFVSAQDESVIHIQRHLVFTIHITIKWGNTLVLTTEHTLKLYLKHTVHRRAQGRRQTLVSIYHINLLKPTGYVMHQQFNIQQLYALPTLYLCVLYLSENKQRLLPLISWTDWFL